MAKRLRDVYHILGDRVWLRILLTLGLLYVRFLRILLKFEMWWSSVGPFDNGMLFSKKNFKPVTLLPSTQHFVVGSTGMVCISAFIKTVYLLSYLAQIFCVHHDNISDRNLLVVFHCVFCF